MRTFEIQCPNPKCRAVLVVPEHFRGLCVRCSQCRERFVVPVHPRVFTEAFGLHRRRRKAG